MRRVVRKDVFETNSSSQHSICITKRNEHINPDKMIWKCGDSDYCEDRVYLYKDGKWNLREIEDGFGRYPFNMLTSFEDKFKYAMCEYMGYLYVDDPEFSEYWEMFKDIAREVLPGFTDFHIYTKNEDIYLDDEGNPIRRRDLKFEDWNKETHEEIFSYVAKDGTRKIATVDQNDVYEVPCIGTIDHQSAGLLKNFLKDEGISLKEFLTNKKYIVIIDGDEYCDWSRYKMSGIINLDFIEKEYGTSGEDLEYREWLKEQEKNENESGAE